MMEQRYETVRTFTEQLCEPLATEDYVIQSMPDASPTRWHLAHSTWFFEKFILEEVFDGAAVDSDVNFLFNSYYNAAGDQFERSERGLISRPTVAEVYQYRTEVDRRMLELLDDLDNLPEAIQFRVEVGLNHEQQHQELMLTDLKHMLARNPLEPVAYETAAVRLVGEASETPALRWRTFDGGVREIGHDGDGFSFDNERSRHEALIHPFEIANRPVTNGEYIEFIEDGGYGDSRLWLSEGWTTVQAEGWEAPLYWEKRDGQWWQFTLGGMREVDPNEPVTHVSYFEADAFATWADARLPTEFEWEVASRAANTTGTFADSGRYHPAPAGDVDETELHQFLGDVWEWTASSYAAYPGFEPWEGAIGEYNGKFMCGQYVLRGGSCATSESHIRPTYRNFFYPPSRWQYSGIRLAR